MSNSGTAIRRGVLSRRPTQTTSQPASGGPANWESMVARIRKSKVARGAMPCCQSLDDGVELGGAQVLDGGARGPDREDS